MINTPAIDSGNKASLLSRWFAIAYALFAYGVGSVALFWFFFAAIGTAPYSLSAFKADNLFAVLAVNIFLVMLFAMQHTIMARKSFKQKWTQIIPEHLERSTFVLVAGILMAAMLWYWQMLPGVIWATPDMSVTRLVLAVLLTIYLFIGIQFEEHSLIQEFGDKYKAYKKDIGMFFTFR